MHVSSNLIEASIIIVLDVVCIMGTGREHKRDKALELGSIMGGGGGGGGGFEHHWFTPK